MAEVHPGVPSCGARGSAPAVGVAEVSANRGRSDTKRRKEEPAIAQCRRPSALHLILIRINASERPAYR